MRASESDTWLAKMSTMWPEHGVIYLIGASTVPSFGFLEWRVKKYWADNIFQRPAVWPGSESTCGPRPQLDLGPLTLWGCLWPCDLKINRGHGHLLPRGIHCTKLDNFQAKGRKILCGHRLVYRPTGAKQFMPPFKGRHKKLDIRNSGGGGGIKTSCYAYWNVTSLRTHAPGGFFFYFSCNNFFDSIRFM